MILYGEVSLFQTDITKTSTIFSVFIYADQKSQHGDLQGNLILYKMWKLYRLLTFALIKAQRGRVMSHYLSQ